MGGSSPSTRPGIRLLLMFEKQQYEGCGDEACQNGLCFSYRKRQAPPARQPTRTSARVAAMALVERPDCQNMLCPGLRDAEPLPPAGRPSQESIDPSSFEQVLMQTSTIVDLFDKHEMPAPHERSFARRSRPSVPSETGTISPCILPVEAGRRWFNCFQHGKRPPPWLAAHRATIPYQVTFFRSICFRRMLHSSHMARRVRHIALKHMDLDDREIEDIETNELSRLDVDRSDLRSVGLLSQRLAPEPLRIYQHEYNVIDVRRVRLLRDALNEGIASRSPHILIRPLRAQILEPETKPDLFPPALDHGGVGQEFFYKFFTSLFDSRRYFEPTNDESGMYWFANDLSSSRLEDWIEIGTFMAVGIHNGYVLPVNFPLAFYQKLKGTLSQTLHEIPIDDGWPSRSRGFKALLECDDDAVGDMCLSCTYPLQWWHHSRRLAADVDMARFAPRGDQSFFDSMTSYALERDATGTSTLDDDHTPVTAANRHTYISTWIDWTINKLPGAQWAAFRHGFYAVIPQATLRAISTPALQAVVQGAAVIDVGRLEAGTVYENYGRRDPTIRAFWLVVLGYSQDYRRRLLQFVTASDRLPAGETVDFTIRRLEISNQRTLPSAVTCSRTLTLPDYASQEILAERLQYVLDNEVGFGVI